MLAPTLSKIVGTEASTAPILTGTLRVVTSFNRLIIFYITWMRTVHALYVPHFGCHSHLSHVRGLNDHVHGYLRIFWALVQGLVWEFLTSGVRGKGAPLRLELATHGPNILLLLAFF